MLLAAQPVSWQGDQHMKLLLHKHVKHVQQHTGGGEGRGVDSRREG